MLSKQAHCLNKSQNWLKLRMFYAEMAVKRGEAVPNVCLGTIMVVLDQFVFGVYGGLDILALKKRQNGVSLQQTLELL